LLICGRGPRGIKNRRSVIQIQVMEVNVYKASAIRDNAAFC
jgi:hypothetical protein